MSKKFWSVISLLLIAAMALAACKPAAEATTEAVEVTEPVTITVWH